MEILYIKKKGNINTSSSNLNKSKSSFLNQTNRCQRLSDLCSLDSYNQFPHVIVSFSVSVIVCVEECDRISIQSKDREGLTAAQCVARR